MVATKKTAAEEWDLTNPKPEPDTGDEARAIVGRKRPGRVVYGAKSFDVVSTILDRDAKTRADRQAFLWAGMPLDSMSADGRWRLQAAAMIRQALEEPDPDLLAAADRDDSLLAALEAFVAEHQALFRHADSGAGQGDPGEFRVAVVPLDAPADPTV